MHIQESKILSAYPYQGDDPVQKKLFYRLKAKYGFNDDDDELIKNISHRMLSPELIESHAASCYAGNFHVNQMRFFKIVKLTKHCHSAVIAGGNALRVLLDTNFSFQSSKTRKLSHIHATDVSFKNKILDGVILKGATLPNSNFTRTSMNGVVLDDADLNNVTFGQLPYLLHDSMVLAMAINPDGSFLVSHTEEAIYLWDAKTGANIQKIGVGKYNYQSTDLEGTWSPQIFLKFLENGKCFFRASGKGEIDVWGINPLIQFCHVSIPEASSFKFFSLSKDGQYILSIACVSHVDRLDIWGIEQKGKDKPIELRNLYSLIIEGTVLRATFSENNHILGVIIKHKLTVEFYDLSKKIKMEEWTYSLGENLQDINSLCFTRDGSKLLLGKRNELFVLNYEEKKCSRLIPQANSDDAPSFSELTFSNLQFIPNSYHLMYHSRDTLCIRDMSKNGLIKMYREFYIGPSPLGSYFISDGKQLFQVQSELITITPLSQLSVDKSLPFAGVDFAAAYIANQYLHLINGDGVLFQYKLQSGIRAYFRKLQEHVFGNRMYMQRSWRPIGAWESYKNATMTVTQLSSNTEWIVSGSKIDENHQILISTLQDGTEIFRYRSHFSAFALSQDNLHLVIAYQNELQLWDLKKKVCVRKCSVDKIPDYEVDLVISDNIFPVCIAVFTHRHEFASVIWKINWNDSQHSAQKIAVITADKPVFINDQNILFRTKGKGLFLVWNGFTGKSKTIDPCKHSIHDFDASKNGLVVLSYHAKLGFDPDPLRYDEFGYDPEKNHSVIVLYDIKKGKILDQIHLRRVHSPKVHIAPDESYALVTARIGDLVTHLYLYEIVQRHFQIIWKLPQELDVRGMRMKNVKNLSAPVQTLLTQLKVIGMK